MEGEGFDVFLSHSSADTAAAVAIAERLVEAGIEPWLDVWRLSRGGDFQAGIAEGLRASACCAVLVGPGGLGEQWVRLEANVAVNRMAKDRHFSVFLVLLPGAPEPEGPVYDFLRVHDWVDLRSSFDTPDALDDLVRAIRGLPRRMGGQAAAGGSPGLRLPEGTVSLLATDVEGTTALLERLAHAAGEVMVAHHRIVREAAATHGGVEAEARFDGFLFAFTGATDALSAALAAQLALRAHRWPEGGVPRVRMGIHAGDVTVGSTGYVGVVAPRAARLCAAAHGGQVLVSEAAKALLGGNPPAHTSLLDLGAHRLPDLAEPFGLFQLVHPELEDAFPPLRSLDAHPHNLPAQVTSFIGREQEIAEVQTLLGETRLLTLTGPGGCGKTRLALQVAGDLVPELEDGAWLVELAPISDPALVAHQVAAALRLRDEPGRELIDTVADYLRPRRLLLMLDNCEHVVEEAARLAERLLEAAPGLRILATSREALKVQGETAWAVPSLSIPDPDISCALEALEEFESVRLFVVRAKAAVPSFSLTATNAAAVAGICARLDGIPLAIELAAARVRALAPAEIAARLDDRFRLLTGGGRDVLPRQRTLRALVDWSYDLLSEPEQALLRRLSPFAGGFTLEAAEDVCSGGSIDGGDVLDLLCELVDKSLVVVHPGDEASRYSMLETIRQYGAQRLAESGEREDVWKRYRRWHLDLAERAEEELFGPDQAAWLNTLEHEHDNLRQALQASVEAGDVEATCRLAASVWRFWWIRGYLGEGRTWLDRALSDERLPPEVRAKALHAAGALAWDQADFGAARSFFGGAMALFTELGDERGYAGCLWKLGVVFSLQGDNAGARRLVEEGLAIGRRNADRQTTAACLVVLGEAAMREGRAEEARPLFDESLTHFQAIGDTWGVACSVGWLGEVAFLQEDREAALPLLQRSLRMGRDLGDRWRIAWALATLGELARSAGELSEARSLLRESLGLRREIGQRNGIAESLESLAAVAAAEGDHRRATELCGAADGLRRSIGAPMHPSAVTDYENLLTAIHRALDDVVFEQAWTTGRAMSLDEAVRFALEQGPELGRAAA